MRSNSALRPTPIRRSFREAAHHSVIDPIVRFGPLHRSLSFAVIVMRTAWIEKRRETISSGGNVTQLHYARAGVVTEEMAHVARREKLPESLVMEEVARGRMIIPANIKHENLEPMAIGIASSCKVNANIGASPNASDINEELEKLHLAVKYGADTVMDLSTGGVNLDEVRTAIINASPGIPCSPNIGLHLSIIFLQK